MLDSDVYQLLLRVNFAPYFEICKPVNTAETKLLVKLFFEVWHENADK